jgi:hypothetical protein
MVAPMQEVTTMLPRAKSVATLVAVLGLAGAVQAQDADPELGATQPSSVELGASSDAEVRSEAAYRPSSSGGGGGGTRLALQLRIDAINMLSMAQPGGLDTGPDPANQLLVPLATAGVRLLRDSELFLGVGFGFANASTDDGANEESQSGFSLSPVVSYDLITDAAAAFSLVGILNLASLGSTETCDAGGCMEAADEAFGIGLGVGAGLRGQLGPSVAIGGELGWGFLKIEGAGDDSAFVHGIFGNLLFEASIGI